MKLRGVFRMPGILLEVGFDDLTHRPLTEGTYPSDIELKIYRAVWLDIPQSEAEKPYGRVESAAIFRMIRAEKLLLKVHKRTSYLNQPLEEQMVLIPALQPQMLQYVMRLVVLGGVEAGEVALIARIQRQPGICSELFYEGGNTVIFFHRAIRGAGTILRALVPDKSKRSDAEHQTPKSAACVRRSVQRLLMEPVASLAER